MKRVFIIHGWGGTPDEPMLRWLQKKLAKQGVPVIAPQMPNAEEPTIEAWVPFLAEAVGEPDEETYFIAHSVGGQALMRYLDNMPIDVKIGGVVFIAGWFELLSLEGPEEEAIARPWVEAPLDIEKVRTQIGSAVGIFSDNDPFVPYEISCQQFAERLGAKIVTEHAKGHFTEEDGVTELPSALAAIEGMLR